MMVTLATGAEAAAIAGWIAAGAAVAGTAVSVQSAMAQSARAKKAEALARQKAAQDRLAQNAAAAQQRAAAARRLGIQVPGGFIGHDQGPVSHHCPGDTHSLALTTGEPAGRECSPFR